MKRLIDEVRDGRAAKTLVMPDCEKDGVKNTDVVGRIASLRIAPQGLKGQCARSLIKARTSGMNLQDGLISAYLLSGGH
ncbi:hypothetical protein [Rhizobium sp. P28RR-XV]|uniref:hypothetical protein n=1 Tax=Rhizobium sp. P28RR-XV TaxID=2726737 RepID=UPI00145681D2|nr:hypothetical protein [Rhizobium sp. P28RR-XV]NLR88800.1 hypothetical protein [Rhizobium sp. P28RR-XV]